MSDTFNKILYDHNIDKWMDDKGITKHGTAMGQAIKSMAQE